MLTSRSNPRTHDPQRGAVLVVSLLLLLVMTVLALTASTMTRTQERMAGGSRDHELAFQAAEAGLRAGERMIDDPTLSIAPTACSAGRCQVYELNHLTGNAAYQSAQWWRDNSWTYSTTGTWSTSENRGISGSGGMSHADPRFYIEEVEEVPDTLTVPPTGPPPSRMFYRITAVGEGGAVTVDGDGNNTGVAQVVLQSTYARRFN